jgi:hypothetical protein
MRASSKPAVHGELQILKHFLGFLRGRNPVRPAAAEFDRKGVVQLI